MLSGKHHLGAPASCRLFCVMRSAASNACVEAQTQSRAPPGSRQSKLSQRGRRWRDHATYRTFAIPASRLKSNIMRRSPRCLAASTLGALVLSLASASLSAATSDWREFIYDLASRSHNFNVPILEFDVGCGAEVALNGWKFQGTMIYYMAPWTFTWDIYRSEAQTYCIIMIHPHAEALSAQDAAALSTAAQVYQYERLERDGRSPGWNLPQASDSAERAPGRN